MKRNKKPKAVIYVPDTGSELAGQFAISNNGRYAERMFLVLGASSDGYLIVTDGKKRRIATPKRKNPKHLTLIGKDETATAQIREGSLTDGAVRKMINQKRRNSEDGKCSSESL